MVRIPSEYQEVEYLESTGTQIIVTNLTTTSFDTVDIDFEPTQINAWENIFGVATTTAIPLGGICFAVTFGNTYSCRIIYKSTTISAIDNHSFADYINEQCNVNISFVSNKIKMDVNGETWIDYNITTDVESVPNVSLFRCYYGSLNNKDTEGFIGKIFKTVLSLNGEPVLNFIPCYRISDNEPGMYDTVSKTFFTNQGTGTFLVGRDVNYSTVNLLESRRRILLNTPHIKEASGAIANFKTDVPANLKKCVVEIDPIQDLHGYNYPWPAGGNKNLIPYPYIFSEKTVNGITFSVNSDGSITINGTATANAIFYVKTGVAFKAGTYIAHKLQSDDASNTQALRVYYESGISIGYTQGRDLVFTLSEDLSISFSIYVYAGYTANNKVLYPMVEIGSTASDWTPYSNICPISGRTEIEVSRTGSNLWDEEWEVGYISVVDGTNNNLTARNIRAKNYIPCLPSTIYYLKTDFTSIVYCPVFFYDAEKKFISVNTQQIWNRTLTTPNNAYYMRFYMNTNYGTTYNHDISINYPSADHEYHSYQGQTYDITFPSSAGTVYGGTLDLLSGELVVDRAMIILTGNETFDSRDTSNYYCYDSQDNYYVEPWQVYGISSSHATTDDYTSRPIPDYSFRCQFTGQGKLRFASLKTSSMPIKTTEELKNLLSEQYSKGTPVQVCYKITNPATYQLTSQTLKSIRGVNNIWSDANGNICIKFYSH